MSCCKMFVFDGGWAGCHKGQGIHMRAPALMSVNPGSELSGHVFKLLGGEGLWWCRGVLNASF